MTVPKDPGNSPTDKEMRGRENRASSSLSPLLTYLVLLHQEGKKSEVIYEVPQGYIHPHGRQAIASDDVSV